MEGELYQKNREKDGGWDEYRSFIIDNKEKESEVITSFYLKPKDKKAIASYKPGQYFALRVVPGNITVLYAITVCQIGQMVNITVFQ